MNIRLFRDPLAPGPSLADLDDPNYVPKTNDITDPKNQVDPPGDDKPADDPKVEGVNDDGTLAEGYERNELGEVVKKPDDSADDNPDDDADDAGDDAGDEVKPEAFFEEVNKLTGIELKVEYPEGVDPLTPQGIAVRDKVVREQAMLDFEETIKKADPRAYAYMVHRAGGGADTDFFEKRSAGYVLPSSDELKDSVDMQTAVYKHDLIAKGNSEEEADLLVKNAITNNKLLEKATASHKSIDEAQKSQLAQAEARQADEQKKFDTAVKTVTKQIETTITSGISFVVPESKRNEFQQFVIDKLQYDQESGKFIMVQELDPTDLKKSMEAMLFQFMDGDLSKVVKQQAGKEAAHQLRLRIKKDQQGGGGGSQGDRNKTGYIPLGSL
jgi:hypothetical protein